MLPRSVSVASVLFLVLLSVPISAVLAQNRAGQTEIRDIGSRLELLVDHYLIERMAGVRLKPGTPVPAPISQKPLSAGHYATIILDNGIYRAYNRGGTSGPDGHDGEVTEYFESRDGINWDRPALGLFEVDGSTDNNIILAHAGPFSHNFSPFLDSRPGIDPEMRFKALAGTESSGLHAFVSADGIHWTKLQDEPVFTDGLFDSQNVAFWSEVERQYVCYFRTWTGKGYTGLRTISRTTSPDFIHWTAPEHLLPNRQNEHLYTSGTHPYFRAPHIYIALPSRFQPDRGSATDILFMTSRGGDPFDRTFPQAFIRPGLDSTQWQNRANYAALNVVPTGKNEMSIYNRGKRYTLRVDGFASISAESEQGEWYSRPLSFSGNRLVLNVSTSAGGMVAVELQDLEGRPVPGFSLPDCDEITDDAVSRIVSWNGNSNLASIAGEPVRLRFVMQEADLYSLQFSNQE